MPEQKLIITYYPTFQNVGHKIEELHIFNSNKEHKKLFSNKLIVGFHNGKSLR